jgi:hypothetical protein
LKLSGHVSLVSCMYVVKVKRASDEQVPCISRPQQTANALRQWSKNLFGIWHGCSFIWQMKLFIDWKETEMFMIQASWVGASPIHYERGEVSAAPSRARTRAGTDATDVLTNRARHRFS